MAGAQTFNELKAWQRSDDLHQFVVELTKLPATARYRDFCSQIYRASASATDNIAEGFGRYYPKEFHRYVQIARGELNETRNQLHRGMRSGYITEVQYRRGLELADHALKTTAGLQRYLKSCIPPNKRPPKPRRQP